MLATGVEPLRNSTNVTTSCAPEVSVRSALSTENNPEKRRKHYSNPNDSTLSSVSSVGSDKSHVSEGSEKSWENEDVELSISSTGSYRPRLSKKTKFTSLTQPVGASRCSTVITHKQHKRVKTTPPAARVSANADKRDNQKKHTAHEDDSIELPQPSRPVTGHVSSATAGSKLKAQDQAQAPPECKGSESKEKGDNVSAAKWMQTQQQMSALQRQVCYLECSGLS